MCMGQYPLQNWCPICRDIYCILYLQIRCPPAAGDFDIGGSPKSAASVLGTDGVREGVSVLDEDVVLDKEPLPCVPR